MRTQVFSTLRVISEFLLLLLLLCGVPRLRAQDREAAAPQDVALSSTASTFTLRNGLLTATIDKETASLVSLLYDGKQMLGSGDKMNGYWSMPGTHYRFGTHHVVTVIDDPIKNHGRRATISCLFSYDGDKRSVPADVELRYSLGQGDHAVYLEAIWHHKAGYPELSFPVGRFAVKLNDALFDWMTVDAHRNLRMITASDWDHGIPLNLKEARLITTGDRISHVEHKYDYSAVQFDTPAYGWSSTADGIGVWIINPSYEYMSGGPTKLELTTHRDATFTSSLTAPAAPTLLNIWKGPHYGGTSLVVAQDEDWTKVVGPFLLYCNQGATPDAMWQDALAKAATEAQVWPYRWNVDSDYPGSKGRATVSGRLVLRDPQSPHTTFSHLLVGLAHPDYQTDGRTIDWQSDGKFYQYWVPAGADGRFAIPHVRPGTYTLHAFADGILGEYAKADVQVTAGKPLDLGALAWKPVRYGRQLWEIGVPDRTAGEFLHGTDPWRWGLYSLYPSEFPHDVVFTIGKSNDHTDWNIMQVPRGHGEAGRERGTATTWTVLFDLPRNEHGTATLRLAFAGTEAKSLTIGVNGRTVDTLTGFHNTSAIHRDSDRSYWSESDVPFNAKLLHAGENKLTLTVPAGPVTAGIEYDYLRLEVDESKPAPRRDATDAPSSPE